MSCSLPTSGVTDLPRKIESLYIDGPAGRIEALLEAPEDLAPTEACLVCHPHPLYGGTMYTKVVHRTARALRRAGGAVLRFNFRGVGRSEGAHDNGLGEIEDARTCLNYLRARYPDIPYCIAGFSFGSRITMKLGALLGEPRPARLIGIGFPVGRGNFEHITTCDVPKYFVQSTNDEFGPVADLEAAFATFAEPKYLQFIPSADHFFVDALQPLEDAVAGLPR